MVDQEYRFIVVFQSAAQFPQTYHGGNNDQVSIMLSVLKSEQQEWE